MRSLIIAAAAASVAACPAFAKDGAFEGPRGEVVAGYDHVTDQDAGESRGGLVYGGALGYDHQVGKLVFGVEGEVTGATTDDVTTDIVTLGDAATASAGRDLYAGARVGVAVAPRVLLYAKGGYTNARMENRYTGGGATTDYSENLDGFRLGAGTEVSLGKGLYAKAEYRYSHYGDSKYGDLDLDRHQLLAGVGLRF